jgi:hypothetical protein
MQFCNAQKMGNIKTFTPLKTSLNGNMTALPSTFKWHQLPAAAAAVSHYF